MGLRLQRTCRSKEKAHESEFVVRSRDGAFAVGAIGVALLLWLKRKQLALAAAKAVPAQASKAATEQATGVVNAVPEQASSVTSAIPKAPADHSR